MSQPVDETVFIQERIDDDWMLAAEDYDFAGQLVVAGGASLHGVGQNRAILRYNGTARDDGCLAMPAGSWGFDLANFSLNNTKADKQGVGIRCGATNTGQFGTQSGGGTLSNLWLDGFQYGLQFGSLAQNTSASEVTATNLRLSNCDVGWRIETQNSLNYIIRQFGVMLSAIGLQTFSSSFVTVNGGSYSSVSECVWDANGAATLTGIGMRAENSGYLFRLGFTQATSNVNLINCGTAANTRPDKVDVKVSGGVNLVVTGGLYDGTFEYEGSSNEKGDGFGSVTLIGVRTRQPILLKGTPGTKCRYQVMGCALVDEDNQVVKWIDKSGVLGHDVTVP